MKTNRWPLEHLASAVQMHRQNEIALHEDVDVMYAPSECHDLVEKGLRREMKKLFRQAGWDVDEYNEAVERGIGGEEASERGLFVDAEVIDA